MTERPRRQAACLLLAAVTITAGCTRARAASATVTPPALGAQIGGVDIYDWTGYAMAPAGDVNGDGREDLMVTSLAVNSGGRVMIFYGPITGTLSPANANATFVGEYVYANLGEGTLHAGGCDVNGDGLADVVLGSPAADGVIVATTAYSSGDNRGKAYVFYGRKDLRGTTNARDADVQLIGEADFDAAGSVTACLGDLDADGFDDIAITARRNSRAARDAGAVYIIYGRKDLAKSLTLDKADAMFVGEGAYDTAGMAIALARDLTGDRRDDILIGAPLNDAGGAEAGAVYIVRGQAARFSGQIPLASQTKIGGADAGGRLGWSLDGAGDVNGDGVADAILGSSTLPAQVNAAGAAYLLLGGADLQGAIDITRRAVRLSGDKAADLAGAGVAGVGDMNGDGFADVVVGAPFAEGESARMGRVYLVLGQPVFPPTIPLIGAAWFGKGKQTDGYFGENISALPDLDGDGLRDFAVAARNAPTGDIQYAGVVSLFRSQR